MLLEVVKQPSIFFENSSLRTALKSQGTLSKWSNETGDIQGSSLNTVKRISTKVLDGGFDTLNQLRIKALISLNEVEASRIQPKKSKKTDLQLRIQELERSLQITLEDLLSMTMALENSLSQGYFYATNSNNNMLIDLCIKEQKAIRLSLTLRKLDASKIMRPKNEQS